MPLDNFVVYKIQFFNLFRLTSRYFCENQDCVAHRKGYKEDVAYPNKATV